MHVVVMGCGRVGSAIARRLEEIGHSVAVIDQDPEAFRRLGPEFTGRQVTGLGFDRQTLLDAGIDTAGAFAAVSSGDNSNIISARVARETFGVQHVVARIYDEKRAEVYERMGIPSVATVPWTVSRLLRELLSVKVSELWREPTGKVVLMRVTVTEGWVGRKLAELETASGARAAWMVRFGEAQLPTGQHRAPGGGPARRRRHRRDHRPGPHRRREGSRGKAPLMRVAIVGAGAVGRSIAGELLANGHTVMLIEKDGRKVKTRAVPGAEWVQADACEVSSLEEAQLATCDVVVAATGDDKSNLVVSLLAKTEFAVNRVVARVKDPRNEWLYTEAWGVDVAVSTPRVLAALVEEAVTVGDVVRLMSFRKGAANLVEITLAEDTPWVGRPVRDVPLPRETVLTAILRGERVITPSPDEPLEAGDELLFITHADVEEQLKSVLAPAGRPSA